MGNLLLSLSLHLAVVFGILYTTGAVKEVAPSAAARAAGALAKTHVWIDLNTDPADAAAAQVRKEAAADALGTVPQTAGKVGKPPYTLTVKNGGANTSGSAQTFTGQTPAELLDKLETCPSNVCAWQTNISGLFNAQNRRYLVQTVAAVSNGTSYDYLEGEGITAPAGTPILKLIYRYPSGGQTYSSTLNARMGGVECPAGYSYNTANYSCDLSDKKQARAFGVPDGFCAIGDAIPDPFDPDCVLLRNDNKLSTFTDDKGNPGTVINNSEGDKEVTAIRPYSRPLGESHIRDGLQISRTFPADNGTQKREDTQITPKGVVGPTDTAIYQAPNPPVYPGASPGTGYVGGGSTYGGSTGGGGSTCGSAGQPACKVSVDGLSTTSDMQVGTGLEEGEADAKAGNATDGLFGRIKGFQTFSLTKPTYTCSVALYNADSSRSVLNDQLTFEMQPADLCPLIEPWEVSIREMFAAIWMIGATLMFIRLTI